MPTDLPSNYQQKAVSEKLNPAAVMPGLGASGEPASGQKKTDPVGRGKYRKGSKAVPKVPRFQSCDSTDIKFTNLLVQCAQNFLVEAAGKSYTAMFSPLTKAKEFNSHIAFDLDVGGVQCELVLDVRAASLLFEELLPAENLSDLPAELLIAASEAALDNLLTQCESLVNRSVSITSIQFSKDTKQRGFSEKYFSLSDEDGGQGLACLRLAESLNQILLDALSGLPAAEEVYWNELPAVIRVEFGNMQLTSGEVSGLSSGDVLITDLPNAEGPVPVSVKVGNLISRGMLEKNLITVNTVPEVSMENAAIHDDMSTEPALLEDLQIELGFELGHKVVLLKELKGVKPGYTFELDNSIDTPVNIRVNGKTLGVGQLVKVGDRVGVRVLELANGAAG